MKKILFLVFSFITSVTVFSQDTLTTDTLVSVSNMAQGESANDLTKSEADSAYIRDDYASAIQLYESLLKDKGESAEIYYNLGNSYYKSNNIAKAVLNYERALLLQPGDNDIRFNLDMARSKTVDKVEPVNEVFLVTWIKSLINIMGVDAWAKYAIVSFLLFISMLIAFIFSKRTIIKKLGFIFSIIFLILTISINIFADQQKNSLINRTNAIIISPSVTVKSTPNESGTDIFILHEGRKVSIKDDSMKEWKEIKLEDGNVGWVPANVIEII